MIDRMNNSTIISRIFIFRPIRATMPLNLPNSGTFGPDHEPWLGLSFFSSGQKLAALKRGRLLDRRRMWRVKKPLFCVEKDGYPLSPALFSLADSHMTG